MIVQRTNFEKRDRFTWEEVLKVVNEDKGHWHIRHVLDNEDGTFSIMSHIVCEFCDYCEMSTADKRLPGPWAATGPFKAQPNSYTKRDQADAEWELKRAQTQKTDPQ